MGIIKQFSDTKDRKEHYYEQTSYFEQMYQTRVA